MTTIAQGRRLTIAGRDTPVFTAVAILATIGAAVVIHSTVYALVALVVLVGLAAYQPAASIVAIPAVIGFVLNPVRIRSLEFSPQEVLLVTSVAGIGLHIVWTGVRDRSARGLSAVLLFSHKQFTVVDLEGILLVVLGSISLVTLALPAYRHESLRDYRWVVLEPVIFFVLARWYFKDANVRNLAVMTFISGAVLVSFTGIVGLVTGHALSVEGVTRVSGVYHHPNALALFLERPFVFAIGLAVAFRTNFRWTWLVPAGILGAVLLMTFSRGAILAAGAATIFVLLVGQRRRLAALATGAGAVLFGALAITASARVDNLFSGGSGSLRLDLWESSVAMIKDHLFFGIGLDQFLYVYAPRYIKPQAWSERFTSHPHDIILDVWLRLGIMGVVLALAYLVTFAWLTVKLARRKRTLGLAASGALLVGMLHGLVDNGYFLPDLAIMFWFMTALMVAEAQDKPMDIALNS